MGDKRDPQVIKDEIAVLERKLKARRGKPGFAANVADLEGRIDACRAELVANG